jgi:hypothetical protein
MLGEPSPYDQRIPVVLLHSQREHLDSLRRQPGQFRREERTTAQHGQVGDFLALQNLA